MKALHNLVLLVALATTASGCESGSQQANLAGVREAWRAIALGLAPSPRLHRSSPPDLDRLAALLAEKVGGRWAKALHSGLPSTEQILRGRIDARTDIAMVFYNVFPFGADDVDRQAWLLAAYARADSARIVGVNAQLTVLQLRAEETSLSVQEASRTITQLLGLSPPRIALDTFRPVLAAAARALANAHAREYPEVPVPDSFIAAGQRPKIEQHPQGTIFTWESRVTSGHGFSTRVQLGESGRITVLDANVWRVGE